MARLAPAVEYIVRNSHRRILLHAFSEGGANKAVCLAEAFRNRTGGKRLPVAAFVFDSAPGRARFASSVAAFRRSLPQHPAVQLLSLPTAILVLTGAWLLFKVVLGYGNNPIEKTRRGINDCRLWDLGKPRMYAYSEGDDLTVWKDVESHAFEAAERYGVVSLLVRFGASGHCGHVKNKEDGECYWEAVRRTWETRDVERGEEDDGAWI